MLVDGQPETAERHPVIHPTASSRFSYSVPSGTAVPRGEYTLTAGSVVQIARVERVRQKKDHTFFVEGSLWPAAFYSTQHLAEATFLH
jgi:hypothetical protein